MHNIIRKSPFCMQAGHDQAAQSAGFSIGLRHPPMPSGIEDLGGFLVHGNGQEAVLGIKYVRDRKGTVIWLDQIIYQNGCPDPEYMILDFRRLPPLVSNDGTGDDGSLVAAQPSKSTQES